ncbi:alpha/beta hydrolase fold domain-containing protein [Promicromonospora iranensis]|jgi:predicted dienelactone hydrolase|uniref:poly(ethylene terephthalate) hydrolase family protein n=1 Tax=Promicromonospora iranensis TaxID=1105144 RepID=UPI0023AA1351|nr:alpha/beta hydrolase fold domain-containing protein [Promicromonospora iranensis]
MQSFSRAVRAALAATALAAGTFVAVPAAAADDRYQRGPDPTAESIVAARGTFEIRAVVITRAAAEGYGGGTVYYPTDTSEGTFGAVAISPGYRSSQAAIAWLGPRLASQGFVVLTIDTLRPADSPTRRGAQLLAALEQLREGALADRIDPDRLAVMGHSMGGGGSLEAAKDDPALRAVIPMTPWSPDRTFPEVTAPTLVIGAEDDVVARVRSYAEPIYESLPADGDKAYLELRDASHSAPSAPSTTIAKYSLSWLKRHVDDDERYTQFLCPAPVVDAELSEVRSTCD